jgi:hypothetical protein
MMDDEKARARRAATKALTWDGLAAAIALLPPAARAGPVTYVEPYNDPEAVGISRVVCTPEDLFVEDLDGEETVYLIQVQFFAEGNVYGCESYWVGAGDLEEATNRAMGLSNGSRFADDRVDFTRRTMELRKKEKVTIVVRAGHYMLQ